MYGTQDAAANWEYKYATHLIENGFRRGKASPCAFWNPQTGVRCVVHGDDFTFAGPDDELTKCTQMMNSEYDIKVRGKLGPDLKDDKAITILNRCVKWTPQGIQYETDPRHVEIMINELDLHKVKPVVAPGSKGALVDDEDNPHLDSSQATEFRQLIARCNLLCHDRPDIQYACKEAARGMANPRKTDWEKFIKIAKYLKKRRAMSSLSNSRTMFTVSTAMATATLQVRTALAGVPAEGWQCLAFILSSTGGSPRPQSRCRREKLNSLAPVVQRLWHLDYNLLRRT